MSDSDSGSNAHDFSLGVVFTVQFAVLSVFGSIVFAMAWHYAKKYYAKKHAAEQAQATQAIEMLHQDNALMPLPQETETAEAPHTETPSITFTRQGGGASSPVRPFPECEDPVGPKSPKADEAEGYVSSHARN